MEIWNGERFEYARVNEIIFRVPDDMLKMTFVLESIQACVAEPDQSTIAMLNRLGEQGWMITDSRVHDPGHTPAMLQKAARALHDDLLTPVRWESRFMTRRIPADQ
ncbi:hypothetical protein D1871_11235 [Nakamurella silvestris]|nr:hypothetical protein D1871_11235 [Nakamurella silvestris]